MVTCSFCLQEKHKKKTINNPQRQQYVICFDCVKAIEADTYTPPPTLGTSA